jgi:hypothetical protein
MGLQEIIVCCEAVRHLMWWLRSVFTLYMGGSWAPMYGQCLRRIMKCLQLSEAVKWVPCKHACVSYESHTTCSEFLGHSPCRAATETARNRTQREASEAPPLSFLRLLSNRHILI